MFLRTLASYKIPAVIERRRKELLDKLCLLQGDTLKEAPPVIEPPEEKSPPPPPSQGTKEKDKVVLREKAAPKGRSSSESTNKEQEERGESPASTSSITSPTHGGKLVKRDSKVVNSLIKDYETIHFTAKKAEEDETPKRLVVLKKVAKPVDFRRSSSPAGPEEEGKGEKDEGEVTKGDATDSAGPNMNSLAVDPPSERASSVASMEDGLEEGEMEESEKAGDKKKKKSKLQFGFKGKKKRDKSPAPPEKREELATEKDTEQQKTNEEEEEEVQLADGVKICGVLERNKKKGIGHKKVKVDARVFHTTLVLGGGKEELDLANCTLEETEAGFELTHPQHRSALIFKVDGPEEEKQRWVAVMKDAIAEATPEKEEGKVWVMPSLDSKHCGLCRLCCCTLQPFSAHLK